MRRATASRLPLDLAKPFVSTRFDPPAAPIYHFGNFVVGPSNQFAHAAGRMCSENPIVQFNPFCVFGGVFGKTHLIKAIVNQFREYNPGKKVLDCSAEVFMWNFVRYLKRKAGPEFMGENASAAMVVIHDVEFLKGKEETLKEFQHLVDRCIEQGIQVIVSLKESPNMIPWLPETLRSYFNGGLVTQIKESDADLRVRIIRSHFGEYLADAIADEAVSYIAESVTDHRALIGSVKTLQLASLHYPQTIGREEAEELLAYQLRVLPKKVTLEKIIATVTEYYRIDRNELFAHRRDKRLSQPRQTIMFLARMLTEQSHAKIAEALGLTDPTTIVHGVRQVEKRRESDLLFGEELRELTLTLDPKWQNP